VSFVTQKIPVILRTGRKDFRNEPDLIVQWFYMSRKKRSSDNTIYVSGIAYQAATGFLWAARPGLDTVFDASKNGNLSSITRDNLGILTASAINLALATELGLKSILSRTTPNKVPTGHNLHKLYLALPDGLKEHLSSEYERNIVNRECTINIGVTGRERKLARSPNSIVDALKASKDTFDRFRYIYLWDGKTETYQSVFYVSALHVSALVLCDLAQKVSGISKFHTNSFCEIKSDITLKYKSDNSGKPSQVWIADTAIWLSSTGRSLVQQHSRISIDGELRKQFENDCFALLPSATVGLTLAIEMCFKGVMMHLNLPYSHSMHNLQTNFEKLPTNVQARLHETFNAIKENRKNESTVSFAFSIEGNKKGIKSHGSELADVLRLSSDAFIHWRYLYEIPRNAETRETRVIPLGLLSTFAIAAISTLKEFSTNT